MSLRNIGSGDHTKTLGFRGLGHRRWAVFSVVRERNDEHQRGTCQLIFGQQKGSTLSARNGFRSFKLQWNGS